MSVTEPTEPGASTELRGRRSPAFVRVWVALLVLSAAAAALVQGPRAAVLVLAGGALAATLQLFWNSIRALFGETPLEAADAYALAVPRAEEEQKRAVLRAIKDLEFEHGVGKINDEDFRALTSKYRTEAKRLLQSLDEGTAPSRALAEIRVKERLQREGLVAPDPAVGAKSSRSPGPHDSKSRDGKTCRACNTLNDLDAAFCKRCGGQWATNGEQA